ncbi:MAG TPA: hypothetical protein VH590_10885 [Ktedonobacterales bacterium]|jgi:hypothetical protein
MVPNGFVPWYNVPARRFPAQKWLEQRYPFIVSPSVFARLAETPAALAARRRFPALVWLEAREG